MSAASSSAQRAAGVFANPDRALTHKLFDDAQGKKKATYTSTLKSMRSLRCISARWTS